jgi:hypothetical protein
VHTGFVLYSNLFGKSIVTTSNTSTKHVLPSIYEKLDIKSIVDVIATL